MNSEVIRSSISPIKQPNNYHTPMGPYSIGGSNPPIVESSFQEVSRTTSMQNSNRETSPSSTNPNLGMRPVNNSERISPMRNQYHNQQQSINQQQQFHQYQREQNSNRGTFYNSSER